MRRQVSEQEVAAVVVAHLEALGADLYQEVECWSGVADIVAKVKREIWIVEVKTALSLALICQALQRRDSAHRVIICAPRTKHTRDVALLCAEIGVGLWDLDLGLGAISRVRQLTEPKLCKPDHLVKPEPGHKTHGKAGAVGGGGRWTEFRATCEELARVVRAEPGLTIQAAVLRMSAHHYRNSKSAATSLLHWIERGKVDGVRLQRSHGTHGALTLVLADEAPAVSP